MSENSLLVIDDEPIIGYSFKRALAGEGVNVRAAQTGADGLRQFAELRPGVVVLDFQLPDRTGLDVFREIHARDPHVPVILITAHGTTETAIEAMRLGVFDYLVKPVDLVGVKAVLRRAFEAGRLMQPASALPSPTGDRLLGRSAVIQEMCKLIGRAAPTDATVLILGESGTGKELVARAVYQHSRRAARPFLALNCAALPETLLESELFGHEKGAFTGADRRRVGRFEQCDGGTLFLDEIGDAPPAVQAKLLRVLQDRKFERLGGTETVAADVRLIAATNLNLADRVNAGAFRMDFVLPVASRDRPGARPAGPAGRHPGTRLGVLVPIQRRARNPVHRASPGRTGVAARPRLAGQHPRTSEHAQGRDAPGQRADPTTGRHPPQPSGRTPARRGADSADVGRAGRRVARPPVRRRG